MRAKNVYTCVYIFNHNLGPKIKVRLSNLFYVHLMYYTSYASLLRKSLETQYM